MMTTKYRLIFAWLILAMLIVSPALPVALSFQGRMPEQMISHVFGAMSLMCMCLSMILSARPKGIDAAFAGLDKAYVVHKWLGILAFVTLLIHDTLESEIDGLKSEFTLAGLDWHGLGSDIGVWALNGLLALLLITFVRLIPYRWWYLTHRFMIALFILSVVHFMVIPKPLALGDPGAIYLLAWCVAGLVAGGLALRPAGSRGGFPYRVARINALGNTLTLDVAPEGKSGLSHRAGQFVHVSGTTKALEEWHPFTVSSAPQPDRSLRLTFAIRDRWTKTASETLQAGDTLRVRGPHGRFFAARGQKRQVWLSAGIGVTPFLAWAQAAVTSKGPIDIVHICRDRQETPHLRDLVNYAQSGPRVTLKVYETKDRGRPTPEDILRLLRDRDEAVDVFYCGPSELLETLETAIGQARRAKFRIHTEAFELRTYIPVPKWLYAAWSVLIGRGEPGEAPDRS